MLKIMLMKKPTQEEVMDMWLKKYHNITCEQIVKLLPKEVISSPDWFKLYPCTKEQADEWRQEVRVVLNKKYRLSKRMIERGWWFIELQCAPYEIREDE